MQINLHTRTLSVLCPLALSYSLALTLDNVNWAKVCRYKTELALD